MENISPMERCPFFSFGSNALRAPCSLALGVALRPGASQPCAAFPFRHGFELLEQKQRKSSEEGEEGDDRSTAECEAAAA